MNTANRSRMANELSAAVLSRQELSRFSGGAGEMNEIPEELVVYALTEAGRTIFNSYRKPPAEAEFLGWIRSHDALTISLIGRSSNAAARVYSGWMWEKRKAVWQFVWANLKS